MTVPFPLELHAGREITSLLDGFADPAVIISRDYQIMAANDAYRRRYGAVDPAAAPRCYEVSHRYSAPCDQAGETCPLKNCLTSGQPSRVLHLHHSPEGEEHVDVETYPIRSNAGDILYLLELIRPSAVASSRAQGEGLVGRSAAFNAMLALVQRVAPTDTAVLLLGESGTGKEMVAHALHQASRRAAAAFVPLDCSGLPETLFESELFGHEKGSFTGAQARKIGLVEIARGGTLFLDEIGDVPISLQVKLLRLLETGTFRRVGATDPIKSDFRLVCATHRDLKRMVSDGRFRQDLYYRISSFPINLPPLRERREDLPLLADSLLQRLAGDRPRRVSPQALAALVQYDFPGNIRELRNILERALILADGDAILPEHLPAECRIVSSFPSETVADTPPRIETLQQAQARYLRWAIAQHPGDRRSLAQQLGLSERTLYRKLQEIQSHHGNPK